MWNPTSCSGCLDKLEYLEEGGGVLAWNGLWSAVFVYSLLSYITGLLGVWTIPSPPALQYLSRDKSFCNLSSPCWRWQNSEELSVSVPAPQTASVGIVQPLKLPLCTGEFCMGTLIYIWVDELHPKRIYSSPSTRTRVMSSGVEHGTAKGSG